MTPAARVPAASSPLPLRQAALSTRARRSTNPARPYICRLIVFRPVHVPLHGAVAPPLRHRRLHGRLVTADALGEPTQVRVRGGLASGQPLAQGPGRLLTDQVGEPVRQVQRRGQLDAAAADGVEPRLFGRLAFLRSSDPLEGELPCRRRSRDRRSGRVEPLPLLAGRAEPLRDERVDAAVRPFEARVRSAAGATSATFDEALGDPGVDPLPVPVQPRPARPPEVPGGARLAPQVPEHGPPRQAQFPGDPGGRVASLVELVDSLEPLDQLPTFRPLGLESWRLRDRLDRRSRWGRFGSRYRCVGLGGSSRSRSGPGGASRALRAALMAAECRSSTRSTASRRFFSRCQRSATCTAWEAPSVAAWA